MTILLLLLYGGVGVIAGILGGLLGISGGVVTVPALLFIFSYLDFPARDVMHLAIGTSLASMVINALAATMAHSQRDGVIWPLVKKMIPGLLIGSVLGAFIARQLASTELQMIFALFLILLGIYLRLSRHKTSEASPRLPPGPITSLIAMVIAALSNILGLGGGSIVVPVLLAFKVKIKRAVGTSAATGLVITTLGALSFLYFGLGKETTPFSIGYLYLPAFVMISVAALISAPYGAKLAHVLPSFVLRRIFAVAMIVTGTLMLFK